MLTDWCIEFMRCFPGSYMNYSEEVILCEEPSGMAWVPMARIDSREELVLFIVRHLCRACHKDAPFCSKQAKRKFYDRLIVGVNQFLGTAFTRKDMAFMYDTLSNETKESVELAHRFIDSGFDMQVIMPHVQPFTLADWNSRRDE